MIREGATLRRNHNARLYPPGDREDTAEIAVSTAKYKSPATL